MNTETNMMTFNDRVDAALKNYNWTLPGDSTSESEKLDALLTFAYFLGMTRGVRRVSDRATEKFEEQRKRADECRYYHMAREIVGGYDLFTSGKGFVYDTEYSCDTLEHFIGATWDGE